NCKVERASVGHGYAPAAAIHRIEEIDLHAIAHVLATLHAEAAPAGRAPAAEEAVEQILEHVVPTTAPARPCACEPAAKACAWLELRTLIAVGVDLSAIEPPPLRFVRQQVERRRNPLELLGRCLVV